MSSQTSVSARRESCLSYADVVHLYEVLLHRTPSPDEVEGQLAATTEWQVLLSAIAGSAEFAGHVRLAASAAPPIVNTWHSDLANYTHKAGSLSDDASTLVGLDGWLFLIQGSNSVLDQYQSTFDPGANWANEWTEVIDHRRNEAARLGVEIGLLIVPDKLSAMHEFLPQPYSLDRPPPATILARQLGIVYPLTELRAVNGGAFLRTDTHLSLDGNRALASCALSSVGISLTLPASGAMSKSDFPSSGDLGQNFSPPIVEVMSTYNSLGAAHLTEDNHSSMRAAGRHIGIRKVFRNPDAPDSRTAVIFGDSYSHGTQGYEGVSWYFAQHFREVHFIWSPFGWDSDYVAATGAEVVLCEMAERFVPRPPKVAVDATELTRLPL